MPRNGSSSIAEIVPNSSDRARSRRARQIVHAIASSTSGTRIPGWSEPTHPFSRSRKPSFVYGGGRAASASEPVTPHGAISHVASPKIIPNPTDISDGPSSFTGGPRGTRHRRDADQEPRAPRAPRDPRRREEREDQREEVQDRDVVEVAHVRRGHGQRRRREHDAQEQQRVPVRR